MRPVDEHFANIKDRQRGLLDADAEAAVDRKHGKTIEEDEKESVDEALGSSLKERMPLPTSFLGATGSPLTSPLTIKGKFQC